MLRKWTLRTVTFVLCAALAASAVYWTLRLTQRSAKQDLVPAVALPSANAGVDTASVARALGAPVAAAAPAGLSGGAAARFALKGVVAGAQGGAALIAVDGKPAKPYALGAEVAAGYRLQALGSRHAMLGESESSKAKVRLDLPASGGSTAVPPAD
jgi:general secretion pathway protein C